MVMSTAEPAYEPESPLDVLSRAASLVESGASSGESQSETEPSPPRASAPASLKELHPKFRKMSASGGPMVYGRASCATPPPSYTASLAASGHTSSPEEAPLDFSIRKRSLSPSSDGPPPYKYANPLRQHSPPLTRASQSPSSSLPSSVPSSSSSHQLPVTPAPSYYRPPPYPRTPSPPPPPPPSEARPPPPTYEAAMACKPTSPRVSLTSTSPTFMTLTTRPSPTTIKTGSSEYSSASSTSPTKTDSGARPSVICTGPSASRKEDGPHVANLFKKEENKENKDLSETPRQSRKREVTIVEESGAVDLMEEHFRKSLGDDYKKVFKGAEKSPEQMEVDPVKAFKEDLDMSGYTVEDHFAKALGDTWVKLQAEAEKKDKKAVGHKESQTQLLAL